MEDLENFRDRWKMFDPDGDRKVVITEISKLLNRVEEPLGFLSKEFRVTEVYEEAGVEYANLTLVSNPFISRSKVPRNLILLKERESVDGAELKDLNEIDQHPDFAGVDKIPLLEMDIVHVQVPDREAETRFASEYAPRAIRTQNVEEEPVPFVLFDELCLAVAHRAYKQNHPDEDLNIDYELLDTTQKDFIPDATSSAAHPQTFMAVLRIAEAFRAHKFRTQLYASVALGKSVSDEGSMNKSSAISRNDTGVDETDVQHVIATNIAP